MRGKIVFQGHPSPPLEALARECYTVAFVKYTEVFELFTQTGPLPNNYHECNNMYESV